MVKKYDGLHEFCDVARKCGQGGYGGSSWYGNISFADTLTSTLSGDDSYVSGAEKLMDLLDASVDIPHVSWQSSVYGAYPVVPEFLAGSPTPMRHRYSESNDTAPISIYVSTTCSASVSADTMLKRGTAILALVMKMQQIRPIELYLLAETHGQTDGEYLQVIKVESKPIQVSVAAFVLCHVGFARHLTYDVARIKDGFNGQWPNGYNGGGIFWESHLRNVLGMAENDLYIGAARSWDDMVTKPVEWVNAQVKRFTEREEGE